MREIKFRSWDKKYSKFVHLLFSNPVGQISDLIDFEVDRYENWEQFTGLQDKNGKEIYEGDIVEYSNKETYKKELKVVKSMINEDGFGYYPFIYEPYCGCDASNMSPQPKDCIVIGNIYKNPELLVKK